MILPDFSTVVPVGPLALLFAAMTVKHVLADFVLQTAWMAKGKDARVGWALPLFVHCTIHGVATTVLVLAVEPRLWFLGLFDFVVHAACDRAKGLAVSRLSLSPANTLFWWLLGVDQALHHATDFVVALLLAING